jgi:hypothetical protein
MINLLFSVLFATNIAYIFPEHWMNAFASALIGVQIISMELRKIRN